MKIVKFRKIDDGIYISSRYGVRNKDGIIIAQIFQGVEGRCRTVWDKEYYWIVQYVQNNKLKYKAFKKFKEAKEFVKKIKGGALI